MQETVPAERETEGQMTSLQRENLDDLMRNAERLLALIDSLLDFAKIEAGKMEVQVDRVKIDDLVQRAAATVEPMLDNNCMRLVRDIRADSPFLYTDGERAAPVREVYRPWGDHNLDLPGQWQFQTCRGRHRHRHRQSRY
jgi:signal transduction histidine kinase